MPSPQDQTLQEAITATHTGELLHARELLSRLLKADKDNAEYWLWMSAVVETAKERAVCLQEALRIRPSDPSALRGLALLGLTPADESLALPARYQKRSWQSNVSQLSVAGNSALSVTGVLPLWQTLTIAVVILLVVAAGFIFGLPLLTHPSQTAATPALTRTPRPTVTPSPAESLTPTATIETPLAVLLKLTSTPTPLYVSTPHPLNDNYRVGMSAFQKKDWASAREYLTYVITQEPTAADVFYYIAESYREQKEYDKAAQVYTQSIALNPTFGPAYWGRGWVEHAQSAAAPAKLPLAQKDLETAITNDPYLIPAYLELATVLTEQGKASSALPILQQALAQASIQERGTVQLALAEVYIQANQPAKAVDAARQAVAANPRNLSGYRTLGMALQANGDEKSSLEPLSTYLQYTPAPDAPTWVLLGRAYQANQRGQDALQAFTHALSLDEKSVDALLLRAHTYLTLNQPSSALDDFQTAQRYTPNSFEIRLGIAQAKLALKRPGDAYVGLNESEAMAVTDLQKADFYYWRAQSLDALKENLAALRDWRALLAIPPAALSADYRQAAQAHIASLTRLTPSPTPTVTASSTATPLPTSTRWPTSTATPTPKP